MPVSQQSEQTPLLQNESHPSDYGREIVRFDQDGDTENPREWSLHRKYIQVLIISIIALIGPMASSIIAPALDEMAESFHASTQAVLAGQSVFVCMLGIGPLLHAPMSETFGRRGLFVGCFALFALSQIPLALIPSVESFIIIRVFSGFFGSVGVANGGGSIFDMFETHERGKVLGVYLVCPLLGPTIGPLVGGLIVGHVGWQWIFWFLLIVAGIMTIVAYFLLFETNAVVILEKRKQQMSKDNPKISYEVEGASQVSIPQKIRQNCGRALRILVTQPIVSTLSAYQALVFTCMYSLYAEYATIWSQPPYNFDSTKVGLAYLGPALGFILLGIVIVVYVDSTYNYLAKRNGNDGLPEYRLPFANIGAVFLPVSLFWFGWAVEFKMHWTVPLVASVLFGASQVALFNPVQMYYIDSFAQNAASAVAAGAFLRSVVGGVIPLFAADLFANLGYGWGMSVFGFMSVALMPAPLLFSRYGRTLRERFPFKP